MKLEPPVPVPVDSILSWGCDDDLLGSSSGGKFNSCDVADSTTGGGMEHHHHHLNHHLNHLHNHHHHLSGALQAGSSSGTGGLLSGCSGSSMKNSGGGALLSLDNLDGLLLSGASVLTTPTTPGPGPGGGHSFAELKPLPPFEYGSMSSSSLDGSLNSSGNSATGNVGMNGTRTILDINLNLYKTGSGGPSSGQHHGHQHLYSTPYDGGGEPVTTTTLVNGLVSVGVVKAESMADYLMNPEIDDIAAIIGNAIADSTVASAASAGAGGVVGGVGVVGGGLSDGISLGPDIRDPWADIDAWIESACSTVYKNEPMLESPASSVTSGTSHSSLSSASPAFAHPSLPPISTLQQQQHNSSCSVSSTLQALLSQGAAAAGSVAMNHMSHGDPSGAPGGGGSVQGSSHPVMGVKSEPSMDMPLLQRRLTAGREPINSAGSTGSGHNFVSCSMGSSSSSNNNKELQLPHTTFQTLNHVSTSLPHGGGGDSGCHSSSFPTARRSTAIKSSSSSSSHYGKDLNDLDDPMSGGGGGGSGGGSGKSSKHKNRSSKSKMTTVMTTEGGKEKPVHRCNICNRGFLNKSNIKVHLRTHTGEKPFKCDACAKAFRQKAHLLKHMQIHKRISRD